MMLFAHSGASNEAQHGYQQSASQYYHWSLQNAPQHQTAACKYTLPLVEIHHTRDMRDLYLERPFVVCLPPSSHKDCSSSV